MTNDQLLYFSPFYVTKIEKQGHGDWETRGGDWETSEWRLGNKGWLLRNKGMKIGKQGNGDWKTRAWHSRFKGMEIATQVDVVQGSRGPDDCEIR